MIIAINPRDTAASTATIVNDVRRYLCKSLTDRRGSPAIASEGSMRDALTESQPIGEQIRAAPLLRVEDEGCIPKCTPARRRMRFTCALVAQLPGAYVFSGWSINLHSRAITRNATAPMTALTIAAMKPPPV